MNPFNRRPNNFPTRRNNFTQQPNMMPPGVTGARGDGDVMTPEEALARSGLGDGGFQSRLEWRVVVMNAMRQGLCERVGRNHWKFGPEFWQAVQEEFGNGNSGPNNDDFGVSTRPSVPILNFS